MSIKISDHFTYKKLLLFVLPSVLMMVFTSIYGVVDGFFVSNYAGKTAFAAVNFILPLMMILGGLGFMMGTGGSALIAMNLGAAVATIISQCFGGIVPLLYFTFVKDQELKFGIVRLEAEPLIHACGNGSSELASNVSISVVSIVYNAQLLKYAGENGVAAYGVIMYVAFIFIAMFMGYSIGAAPIISFHFGADNHSELRNMRKKSIRIMAVSGVLMMQIAQLSAGTLAKIYVGYDQALLTLTVRAFHIYTLAFVLSGINIFASSLFTALNNGPISALIAFMRSLVFELLSVLILPLIFGIDGIWGAVFVAEVMAFIMSMFFMLKYKKKYNY